MGLSRAQARLLSDQLFEAHQQHQAISKLATPEQKEALGEAFYQNIVALFAQQGKSVSPDQINIEAIEELSEEVIMRNILLAIIELCTKLPVDSLEEKARILDEFVTTVNTLTAPLSRNEANPLANPTPWPAVPSAPDQAKVETQPLDEDASLVSLPFWFKDSWARDYPSLVETKTLLSEIFSHYFGSQAFTDQQDPEAMVTLSKRLQELLDEIGLAIIQGTVANAEDYLFAVSEIHTEDLTYTLLDTLLTKDQITEVFTSFYTSEEYEALSLPG